MTRFRTWLSFGACIALLPALAHAHPGHDGHELTWDFKTGVLHPFSGWDHLLAMIAIGVWAAQCGGRARWLVPAVFLGGLALGAVAGRAGLPFSGIEQGIAASVFILGLLISASVRPPMSAGLVLTGGFAWFHGAAHGAEILPTMSALEYGAGFVLTSCFLHLVGLALGLFATTTRVPLLRYAGCAIVIAGLGLLSS